MDEKKVELTDEEWFEEYAKACKSLEDGYCEQLAYGGTSDAQTEKEIEIDRRLIAYVHRLQDENAGLKERGEIVINSLHETIDKQKAEIERLMREKTESAETAVEVLEQNIELQKQVDELKNRFENKACCNMSENCSMVKQAVKDTAKEIYDELKNEVISVDIPRGGEPSEEDCEAVLWWKIEKILRKKAQVE